MPPVISIVGHSKSGKTTLVEKLVRELKARGYRVATVKHALREADFDRTGKDSWRHIEAGSEATVISSRDRLVMIKPVAPDITLDEIVQLFGEDYDIVLVEGFKQDSAPKIEVHRSEVGPLLSDLRKLIAIATDETIETRTRQFPLSEVGALADFLEEGFIKPQSEWLSVYANGVPLTMSSFPRDFVSSVLLAMASCLKGVKEVRSLKFFLRKRG